ncbi:MAG: T9SS type A sorting domain-containing protein, partial [Pedobacter sp.]
KLFNGIAQWDGDSLKWKSLGTGLQMGAGGALSYAGEVNQLIDKDTLLIAGGYFDVGDSGTVVDMWTSQLGPRYLPLKNVGIWYKGSKKWGRMGSGTNGIVNAMLLIGDDVYVGGMFTTAGGFNTQLAKYNLVSKQWTSLDVTDEIWHLVTDGSAIYVTGHFIDLLPGDVQCYGLAKYDLASGTWSNISGSYIDHSISAITISGNYMYMANYDGNALVKYDLTNNTYTVLHSDLLTSNGMGGIINSLTVSGNYLYIGGLFDGIGGIQSKNFAIYNLNTGVFSNQRRASNNIAGANGEVKYITVYNDVVYATGSFSILNKSFSSGLGTVAVPGSVTAMDNFVSKAQMANEIFCYPNPASSEIRIKDMNTSYTEIRIVNMLGDEVKKMQVKGDVAFGINDLEPGIYEVILVGDKDQKIQKLIIQK